MVASQSIPEVQPAQRPPVARRMRNRRPAPAPGSCLGDLPIPLKRRGNGVVNNYGYRYYHPELGRWITRDPIEERGGNNLYAITGNNPLSWIDYLGLEPKAPVLPPAPFDNPFPKPNVVPAVPPPANNFQDLGQLPGGFGPAKKPQVKPQPPNPQQPQWWGAIAIATQK
ncbi:MAG: hypothetical protein CFE26_18675, partial [Verrucomicrobiales bacterium VVV1]